MTQLLSLLFFFYSALAFAKVEVLFHPFDSTLEKIASRFALAEKSIDIAMYNLDVTDRSPIIQILKTPEMQDRLQSGDLKIRILLNQSAENEKNSKKKEVLESLGLEVGTPSVGPQIHHKFAVIDAGLARAEVITGSANWSWASFTSYDENIIFTTDEPFMAAQFSNEFQKLWSNRPDLSEATSEEAFFNSLHFRFTPGRTYLCRSCETFTLTRKIVAAIESAQTDLKIATTRVRLPAIYEALQRAAARGVKIELLVSMDGYQSMWNRAYKPTPCSDVYNRKCSLSAPYPIYLVTQVYDGKANVHVRFKYYDFRIHNYISAQMHSKYMIVDNQKVYTGSFNWSESAEYNFLENLVVVTDSDAVASFNGNFERIYNQGRDSFKEISEGLSAALKSTEKIDCSFTPMSLELKEIDSFHARIRKAKRSTKTLCL